MQQLLNKITSGPAHTKLSDKSKSILDIFTKTIKDLESVNTEADSEIAKREEAIKKASEEKTSLETTKANNITVISKINKIFE